MRVIVVGIVRDARLIRLASHVGSQVHEVGLLGGRLTSGTSFGDDRIPVALGGGGVGVRKRSSEVFQVAGRCAPHITASAVAAVVVRAGRREQN